MNSILVRDLRINYFDNQKSSGVALVFIHGNSHSFRTFRHQLQDPRLSEFRLVALDLPGHGHSSRANDYSLPFFASVLSDFVRSLGLKNFILIGHSMGGHVAMHSLASLRPKGLCIFGAPPVTRPMEADLFLDHPCLQLLFKEKLEREEVIALASSFYCDHKVDEDDIEELQKADGDFRSQLAGSVAEEKFLDEMGLLKSYKGKLAVFHGSEDALVNGVYIAGKVSDLDLWGDKVMAIPSTHNLHVESPEIFNGLLSNFVADVTRGQVSLINKVELSEVRV